MRNLMGPIAGVLALSMAAPASVAAPLKEIISPPTEAQLIAAFPAGSYAKSPNEGVELICVVTPGPRPNLTECMFDADLPDGALPDAAYFAILSFTEIAPSDRPNEWREVTLALRRPSATSPNKGPHGEKIWVEVRALRHREPWAPMPLPVPRPPVANRGELPPPAPKPVGKGPCVWESIGGGGQQVLQEEVRRSGARIPNIINYYLSLPDRNSSWRPVWDKCGIDSYGETLEAKQVADYILRINRPAT